MLHRHNKSSWDSRFGDPGCNPWSFNPDQTCINRCLHVCQFETACKRELLASKIVLV